MLCSTHWATQALQRPLTTAVLMSCSATEEHSRGVYVALSALMSCAFSFHPAQDWWSGRVTCKRVLRRVAFTAWAAGGQGALLYDYLRCHIDEGRIGSGLIWVLHHGDVWSSRLGSSSGTCVCVHLCGSLAKCFPSVKRCCCSVLFPPLDLHHRAGGLHYSLNSIHDFMENHSPKWSCLFSFSHLNTQEKG